MSGTSLDAIDVSVCDFSNNSVNVVGFSSLEWPEALRSILYKFASESVVSMNSLARTHFLLAEYYAEGVQKSLENAGVQASDIRAIGLHGQTIRHLPRPESIGEGLAPVGATLQIGSGSALTVKTGIDVVSDFRSADVAVGGQGAPLVPMFDYGFLRSATADRLIVNIGGISNVTWLPIGATPDDVIAFDSGPGNMLIDSLSRKYFNEQFDSDGVRARSGKVDHEFFSELISHEYFNTDPPKSTGRELFGDNFLKLFIEKIESGKLSKEDALAAATELTASSIASSLSYAKRKNEGENPFEIIVSGGGAKNSFLMERLRASAPKANVLSSSLLGIDPQQKESIAFAYFAKAFVHNELIHLPSTTGATRRVHLGSLSRGH
jgi:anhydro-N-acetylmuramic acid kinase